MSLRDALRTAVARCTPLPMQHATFDGNDATADETPVQPTGANPHGIRAARATAHATNMQQVELHPATQGEIPEKLHVAFASTCNTQPGPLTAHRVTAALIAAAMRRCDQFGDGEAARAEMRADCLALPIRLQQDLLEHFEREYGGDRG